MGSFIIRYEYTATSSGITFVEGQSSPIDIGTLSLTPHTVTGAPPLTAISNVSIAITQGSGDLSLDLAGSNFSLVGDTIYEGTSTSPFATLTHSTGVLNIAFGVIRPSESPDSDGAGNVPLGLTDLANLLNTIEYFNSSNAPGTSAKIQFTFSGNYVYNQPSITINIAETDTLPAFTSAGAALGSISAGTTSGSFAVSSFRPPITDADGPSTGIAITSTATAGAGGFEYSTDNGLHWTAVGAVSASSALVLRDTDLLRFVGTGQTAADASFTYRAWDQYGGSDGSKVDTAGNFGIGAASSAATATLHLLDLNDAPVLTPAAPVLAAITEDNVGNAGQTVASFIGSSIADADVGAHKGIAITALAEANGHWQYSLDGGATWATIGAVATSSALLLRDTDLVRFNPDGLNGTEASLTYRAWDQTSGAAGAKVDAGAGGGTTAFSTASDTATLHDASVNDLATVVVAPVSVVEGDGVALGLFYIADEVTITDPDFGDPAGIKYVAGSASVSATGPTPPSGALADYLLIDSATGAVAYDRAAFHWLGAGQSVVYTITFQVHPGNEAAHQEALTFTIAGANDAPVLAPIHRGLDPITEDDTNPAGHTVASFRAPILDNDPGALTGIAITATAGHGDWQYSVDNGTSWHAFVGGTTSALLLADTDLVRFLPDQKNGGQASFTYLAWDQTTGTHGGTADASVTGGSSAFSSANDSVTIAVASINDAPVLTPAHPVLSTITEDNVANAGMAVSSFIGASIGDVDSAAVQGIALSGVTGGNGHWEYSFDDTHWSAVGNASESAALLLQSGDFLRFVPDGRNGTSASLTYHAWDQTSGTHGGTADLTAAGATGGTTAYSTATDTASLAVSDVNDAPVVAGPVTLAAIAEDLPARLITQAQLLSQTSDVDLGHTLTAAHLVIATGQGTLSDNHDGTWSYTPALNDDTSVSFTFDVSDGIAPAISTSATLDITPVDDAPVAQGAVAGGNEGTPISGMLIATDVDNPVLTFSRVAQASHGAVTINTDGSYVYTPDANYFGTDSFTFKANDGTLDSNVATVDLTIAHVNQPPAVAGPVTLSAIAEDAPARLITQAELLGRTTDADGDPLTAAHLVIATGQGSLTDNHDGTWSYTPALNDDTSVSFTFDVSDGVAPAVSTSATLDITPVDDAPVAQGAVAGGNEGTPISGMLIATDVDNPVLTFSRVAQATHGAVTINADGSYVYTPNANYFGTDSFTFKASDGTLDSNIATVDLTVAHVNQPPVVAGPVTLSAIAEDSPARLITQAQLLARTTDVDGDPLTAANLTIATGHGALADNHNGTWSFTPALNDDTSVSFSFDVSDGTAPAVSAGATLDITPVDDAPVAHAGSASGNENTVITGVLNATDVDSVSLAFTVVGQPAHGSLSIGTDGAFAYTPAFNYHGTDSFSYLANDGTLASNAAIVDLTVNFSAANQRVAVRNDFDASGHSSILWQNADGTTAVWSMNGLAVTSGANLSFNPGAAWHAIGTGDFNGDGHSDILWQNADGTAAVWLMNGSQVLSGANVGFNPGAAWHEIAAADFNGDGKADILWQNSNGQAAVWLMDGTNVLDGSNVGFNPGADWHAIAAADFDGDGKADILWQNSNGQAAVWLMNGLNVLSGGNAGFNPGPAWHVEAAGDFNGDGKADILWQNSNGQVAIWQMNGTNVTSGANVGFNPGPAWQVHGTGDFNGDGKADIILQNTDGTPAVWLMDGFNLVSGSNVGFNPGATWQVIPQHHDLFT